MSLTPKLRRRVFGALCLVGALLMLLFGDTKLQPGDPHWLFVVYWVGCFVLVTLAMIAAIRDAGELRREAREEHRELITSTLENIEAEKRERSHTEPTKGNSGNLRNSK